VKLTFGLAVEKKATKKWLDLVERALSALATLSCFY